MSEVAALNNLYPGLGDQIAQSQEQTIATDGTTPIALTVFALDPSTTKAGAAIVQFGANGAVIGAWVVAAALDATANKKRDERAKFDRIAYIRMQLKNWVEDIQRSYAVALDVTAYETPYADFELAQAIGACMSLWAFDRLPVFAVTRATACRVAGGDVYEIFKERTKGETTAETNKKKREKQARLKAAVIEWAAERFAGQQAGRVAAQNEHAADALAVACAVYDAWRQQECAKQNEQKPLLGPGSGTPRKSKQTKSQQDAICA